LIALKTEQRDVTADASFVVSPPSRLKINKAGNMGAEGKEHGEKFHSGCSMLQIT